MPSCPEFPGFLTPRQRVVLRLLLGGLTSEEIAARLHLSRRTVETHRAAILARCGAPNAVALAYQAGQGDWIVRLDELDEREAEEDLVW